MSRFIRAGGQGPRTITQDGCAVEVYTRLPVDGEPELIHSRIPNAASVLDLGFGTGRLARTSQPSTAGN
jgi:hypothetical protein